MIRQPLPRDDNLISAKPPKKSGGPVLSKAQIAS